MISRLPPRPPPLWLLSLYGMIFVLMAGLLMFIGMRLDQHKRVIGTPAQFSHMGPITRLSYILNEPDQEKLLGMQVFLDDIPVHTVIGDYTFWIGSNMSNRVAVVLRAELMNRQGEDKVEIHEGQRVRIFGIVRLLRDIKQIERLTMLSSKELGDLSEERIYISAERVEVLNLETL